MSDRRSFLVAVMLGAIVTKVSEMEASLKAARRALGLQDEDEADSEDESEDEALGWGAGVRDSRRGPSRQSEDEEKSQPDSRRGADQRGTKLRCAKCGESMRVKPPREFKFARNLAAEDEADTDYRKVRWGLPTLWQMEYRQGYAA